MSDKTNLFVRLRDRHFGLLIRTRVWNPQEKFEWVLGDESLNMLKGTRTKLWRC